MTDLTEAFSSPLDNTPSSYESYGCGQYYKRLKAHVLESVKGDESSYCHIILPHSNLKNIESFKYKVYRIPLEQDSEKNNYGENELFQTATITGNINTFTFTVNKQFNYFIKVKVYLKNIEKESNKDERFSSTLDYVFGLQPNNSLERQTRGSLSYSSFKSVSDDSSTTDKEKTNQKVCKYYYTFYTQTMLPKSPPPPPPLPVWTKQKATGGIPERIITTEEKPETEKEPDTLNEAPLCPINSELVDKPENIYEEPMFDEEPFEEPVFIDIKEKDQELLPKEPPPPAEDNLVHTFKQFLTLASKIIGTEEEKKEEKKSKVPPEWIKMAF